MTRINTYITTLVIVVTICLSFSDAMSKMKDEDLLKYGETQIILGKYKSASDTVLSMVKNPSLRFHFLMGICYENQQKWPEAMEHFQKAVTIDPNNERGMIALSYMGLGRALMATQKFQQAIDMFTIVTKQYHSNLDPDYPRYPNYLDDAGRKIHNIADDAQFFIAECYEKAGESENARNAYAKVSRFYPFSVKLSEANKKLDILIGK